MNSQTNTSRNHGDVPNVSAQDKEQIDAHEYLLQPDDEALDAGECTGNPVECQCEQCRDWRIDIKAGRVSSNVTHPT